MRLEFVDVFRVLNFLCCDSLLPEVNKAMSNYHVVTNNLPVVLHVFVVGMRRREEEGGHRLCVLFICSHD